MVRANRVTQFSISVNTPHDWYVGALDAEETIRLCVVIEPEFCADRRRKH